MQRDGERTAGSGALDAAYRPWRGERGNNNRAKTKVGYFEIAGENEGRSSTGNGDQGENEGWLFNRIPSHLTELGAPITNLVKSTELVKRNAKTLTG